MKLVYKFLLPVTVCLFLLSSPSYALTQADCVAKLKDNKETPLDAKAHNAFIDQLCGCMVKATGDKTEPTQEVFTKCSSRLLVISTIQDFPSGTTPKDETEVTAQCIKTSMSSVGMTSSKADDPELMKYCDCVGPAVYKLHDSEASQDEMAQQILAIGDQCAEPMIKN